LNSNRNDGVRTLALNVRAAAGAAGIPEGALRRRLRAVSWPVWKKVKVCEVTLNDACDAKCLFCYNRHSGGRKGLGEMPFAAAARALYIGRRQGCWVACLIGGEPTLREDLPKIAALARKIGYECVKVCSNGLRLADKDYASRLAEAGVNMFDISLHGRTGRIHDRLVGVPGAFKKCLRAFANVRALGLEIGTNQVLNRLNYKTFPGFFEMALCRFGMNYFNIIYGHYRGEMSLNRDLLKVPVSRVAPYIREGMELYRRENLPVLSSPLVNFTPCILPGFEPLMADWSVSSLEDDVPLFLADGNSPRMGEMKSRQRRKAASCRDCVHDAKCLGFERDYAEIFGEKEFVPLREIPEPFPLRPVHGSSGRPEGKTVLPALE